MAKGKVALSATLDTKQADKAAAGFKKKVLAIGTALTAAVGTSMKQIDDALKRLEKVNTKGGTSTATLSAEQEATASKKLLTQQLADERRLQAEQFKTAQQKIKFQKQEEINTTRLSAQQIRAQTQLQRANQATTATTNKSTSATTRLGNAFQNLTSRIIAYGVITAVQRFGSEIVRVTAEFEKTKVALGAIIGDMDEAQRQFDQIKQQAVESPFSIMELTDATKMLAAYGFEASELNSTMNMMADISAGVGVEMSRLVYNLGQIRAQTVLNNRDARDFASAGIPILGALAEKYSELEGRLITTGEVFDMVSARMVSAADVQEVLRDMTEEGGMFYEMQATLADTLSGRISNLTDAFHNMYSEIGESGYGLISGVVSIITQLIKNWEDYAGAVKVAIYVMAGFKILGFIANLGRLYVMLKRMIIAYNAQVTGLGGMAFAWKSFSIAVSSTPFMLLITALATLVTYLLTTTDAASKLEEEIVKINALGRTKITETVDSFKELADAAVSATEGTEEYNEIQEKLIKIYGEMISPQDLQIEKLKELEGNYESLTDAIENNIQAELNRKRIAKIEEIYGEEYTNAITELTGELEDEDVDLQMRELLVERLTKYGKSLAEGQRASTEEIRKIFQEETGKSIEQLVGERAGGFGDAYDIRTDSEDIVNSVAAMNNAVKASNRAFEAAAKPLGLLAVKFDEITEAGGSATTAVKNFFEKALVGGDETNNIPNWIGRFTTEFDEAEAKRDMRISENIKQVEQMINEELAKRFTDSEYKIDLGDSFIIDTQNIEGQLKNIPASAAVMVRQVVGELNKFNKMLIPTTQVEVMEAHIRRFATEAEISLDKVSGYLITSADNGFTNWGKRVSNELTATIAYVNTLAGQIKAIEAGGITEAESDAYISVLNQKDEAIAKQKVLTKLLEQYAITLNKTGDGKNHQLEELKEQIQLIEKVRDAYAKFYEQSGDAGKSAKAVKDAYGDIFSGVFAGTGRGIDEFLNFDDSKVVGFINSLIEGGKKLNKEANSFAQEVRSKYIFEIQVQANKTEVVSAQKTLDSLFRSYTIGIEIEQAGNFGDIFRNLFKDVEDIDFSTLEDKVEAELGRLGQQFSQTDFLARVNILESTISSDESTPEQKAAAQSELDALRKSQEEYTKMAEDARKKLFDIEKELTSDRIQNYNELLDGYASFEERRVRITEQAEKDIQQIRKDLEAGNISEEEAVQLASARTKEQEQEIAAVNLEEIETEDLWQQAFGDTEDIATESIEPIIKMLQQMSETVGLPIEDIERLQDKMSELQDLELERMNPFEALEASVTRVSDAMGVLSSAQTALANAEKVYAEAQTSGDPTSIISATQEWTIANNALFVALNNLRNAQNSQRAQLQRTYEATKDFVSGISSAVSGVKDFASELSGGELSDASEDIFNIVGAITTFAGDGIGVIEKLVTNSATGMKVTALAGFQAMSTLEKASVILTAISMAMQVATAIFQLFDQSNDEEIDGVIEDITSAVQELDSAMQSLEAISNNYHSGNAVYWENMKKSVASAKEQMNELAKTNDELWQIIYARYGEPTYVTAAREAVGAFEDLEIAINKAEKASEKFGKAYAEESAVQVAYLKAENEAIEAQIAAEKARVNKKGKSATDWDAVADYERQYTENLNAMQEAYQEFAEEMFGTDAVSASEDMVQGMIDAWQEGADYMKVMEDSFDAMIENMIVKAYAGRVIGTKLQEIFDDMGKEVDEGTLTEADIMEYADRINNVVETGAQNFDSFIVPLLEALDLDSVTGDTDMTDLQKGIQGVTETTAGAIEAYMAVLISNDFVKVFTMQNLLINTTTLIAINTQVLSEIRSGNATRRSILTALQNVITEDGRAVRTSIL